jgi:uncharacterized UBP type Zn finger protein
MNSPSGAQLKGLSNRIGDNNCFLNVVIQALWQLDAFRNRFSAPQHKHVLGAKHCVYCSLESIFTQYRFSGISLLPPTALRETLAILFQSSSRFQMFELDDAAEAFVSELERVNEKQRKKPRNNNFSTLTSPIGSHLGTSTSALDL